MRGYDIPRKSWPIAPRIDASGADHAWRLHYEVKRLRAAMREMADMPWWRRLSGLRWFVDEVLGDE